MTVLTGMLAQADPSEVSLTPAGTAIMVISIGMVLVLCAFCFWRILREPAPAEHHHAPLDIDTQDRE